MAVWNFDFTPTFAGQSAVVTDVNGGPVAGSPVTLDANGHAELTLDGSTQPYTAATSNTNLGLTNVHTTGTLDLLESLGAGGIGFDESGSGAPTTDPTTVDPGYTYLDTTNGALYMVFVNPSGPTNEWSLLGGEIDGEVSHEGVIHGNGVVLVGKSIGGIQALVTDVDAYNNSGNGVQWVGTGTDGEQSLTVRVGPVGSHVNALNIYSDGSSEFAGVVYFDQNVNLTAQAAPADVDINAGQVFVYFDSTDGAAKIGFKGKSADGTVVAGNVALS